MGGTTVASTRVFAGAAARFLTSAWHQQGTQAAGEQREGPGIHFGTLSWSQLLLDKDWHTRRHKHDRARFYCLKRPAKPAITRF
jgi:hypothetical protein